MLYNKYPEQISKEQREQLQQKVPTHLDKSPVDLSKFLDAMKNNKDKDNFYVTQVGSVEELLKRANETKNNLDKTCEKVI